MMVRRKLVVLVVDDDPVDCIIAQKVLENTGLADVVTTKNSAKAALDYLQIARTTEKSMPDHLFLDINMPEMSGFEFLDSLSYLLTTESAEKVKIHILTSSIHENDKNLASKHQLITNYITKPFNVEKAIEILK